MAGSFPQIISFNPLNNLFEVGGVNAPVLQTEIRDSQWKITYLKKGSGIQSRSACNEWTTVPSAPALGRGGEVAGAGGAHLEEPRMGKA